jgi:fumarate reductase flavoprotein subunit
MSATVTVHPAEGGADVPTDAAVTALVVGAGACGLVASLVLAEAGIDVLLVERDARPSGSTALSSGFIPAAGTRAQRACGIDDSLQRLADDIQRKAGGAAAAHLVKACTEAIGPALDHLAHRHGLHWEVLQDFLYPGHSRHRMHTVPGRTGAALMGALLGAAESAGVSLLTQARAVSLAVDGDGRVRRVGLERPDGRVETVACEQLLLACNGFGGAADLRARFLPAMAQAPFAGHVGNDGTAVRWGEALGAGLADMAACQGHGAWAVPQGCLISWALMMEGGLQVNARGDRFHDETAGYSEASLEVLAQPGGTAWCVFDETLLALARRFPDFRQAEAAGALRSGADAAALAAAIGCEPSRLAQALAERATTDRFGRPPSRALVAPLHAVRVTGALFHTQGGLAIDADARVLRRDGTPLPNLWAAGGAARGLSGPALEGYLSGNGLLSAIGGAWVAAHAMLRAAPAAARSTGPQEHPR